MLSVNTLVFYDNILNGSVCVEKRLCSRLAEADIAIRNMCIICCVKVKMCLDLVTRGRFLRVHYGLLIYEVMNYKKLVGI